MKIHVENYGVIGSATIDLSKPLTIFCGGNGTGKTYMSYLVYAMGSLSSISKGWRPFFDLSSGTSSFVKEDSEVESNVEKWIYSIEPKFIKRFYETAAVQVRSRIDEIFGLSDEDAELMFKNVRIRIPIEDSDLEKSLSTLHFNFGLRFRNVACRCVKEDGLKVAITVESPAETSSPATTKLIKDILQGNILQRCVENELNEPSFLPVERNSIYTFNKELSLSRNNLIDEILQLPNKKSFDPFMYVQKGSKRYPLAIREAINIANDLSTLKKQRGEYYAWATEIEEKLLHGKVDVNNDGDVIFLPKGVRAKKGALPVHMTASVVKTLSSFVFYLKYQAKRGHLIIIDEPEMNFHPDSQVLFVSIVADLINAGLRFLISTHSDYIIREFNKLVLEHAVRHKFQRQEIGHSLSKDKIKAYYFSYPKRSRKVFVQELEMTETGFSVPSIDAVVDEQNMQIEKLLSQLYFE